MIGRCQFWVPGKAVGYSRNTARYGFLSPRHEAWRQTVRACYLEHIALTVFPKSGEHTTRVNMALAFHGADKCSDLDNLAKEVMDALNGLAYDDDKRIRQLEVAHADGSSEVGVVVTLTFSDDAAPPLKPRKSRKKVA